MGGQAKAYRRHRQQAAMVNFPLVGTPTHTSNFCTIRGFHTPRVGRAHFPGNLLGAPELESGSQLNHQLDSGKNMHKLIIGSALLAVSAPAFAAECYIVQNPRTKV
jgi:hypothetical protein